jgi:hypothetical protein
MMTSPFAPINLLARFVLRTELTEQLVLSRILQLELCPESAVVIRVAGK